MRYIVIIGIAVIAGILIRIKSKYRTRVIAGFAVIMMLMSVLYNIRLLGKLLPFYRPLNQTFYQTDFLKNGEYPDSLLMLLFKGKTVYLKDDAVPSSDTHGRHWIYGYYHLHNVEWFLECMDAKPVLDDGMNDIILDDAKIGNDFEELGITNDMFRNSFMYNDMEGEWGNYFYYYWYYYERLDTIRAYMNVNVDSQGKTVFDTDELVLLWNAVDGVEEEDIYIMTRDYFDKEVAGNE